MIGSMDKHQVLARMGIPVWQFGSTAPKAPITGEAAWAQLQQEVSQCKKCALCQSRTQTVFGTGARHARLVLIGEAPGANEDRQGEPFVGRAGQLLNRMLQSIGFAREEVYIGNVLKCRPPYNRDPEAEEVAACSSYLDRQLALLQPDLIVALGRVAARYLLGLTVPLWQMRGRRYTYSELELPLLITYHPAYLLRNPRDKGKAYQDLLAIKHFLEKIEKAS